MTANTIHNHDLATTGNMVFDELFQDDAAAKCNTSRFDSSPYDEEQASAPALAPVSPCDSGNSSSYVTNSITGRYANIEYRYHVDPRVLGTGHYGSVRECVDRVTGRRYAVKSIRKSDPAVKPRGLAREIQMLREMSHRSIVALADVFEDADYVHLVTDLCEGGELFDRIVQESSDDVNDAPCFEEGAAARIIHQVLASVKYMHGQGVAHRDLKPENILLESAEDDSPIKIIDFGLSRRHDESRDRPMSTIVGTPYYIAPEVLRKRYDKRCDLWSVGVIAYILLCGYPPFNGADNVEVHDAVRSGRYSFPSAEWSRTTREARDFVRRLLRRDPRNRMTIDEALKHPWITKHVDTELVDNDENRQDDSSAEVVFDGMSRSDAVICGGIEKERLRIPLLDL